MNRKFPSIFTLLMLLSLAACGPAPEPTLSSEDLASTAVADAWIAVTQTQAAIPTNTATPIPPTPTPLPTFTPFPTIPLVSPTPVAAATDTCNQPPPIQAKGALAQVKLINKSGGGANLSLGMNSANTQGECVTYTFTLGTFEEAVETILAGCYWAYAWIDGSEPSTAQTTDLLCFNDPNKAPAVWIGAEVIAFH